MNRETFVTLNKIRLFTADQVVDIVQSERDKVLDMVLEMSELCTMKEGIHIGYLQFTALQYSVGRIRQAGEP